jgi:hypothetical protein
VPTYFAPVYGSEEILKLNYSLKTIGECVERKSMTACKIPKCIACMMPVLN